MSVSERDYQMSGQVCGPCQARAMAGIIGPCPSCFRKQNPNPYRDQDGTATKVDPRLHELNRSMTDAERKLVDGTLAWMELRGPIPDLQLLGSAILRERKPPEPRPITPEELAVVEAAKAWLENKRLGPQEEFADQVANGLVRALRRLK